MKLYLKASLSLFFFLLFVPAVSVFAESAGGQRVLDQQVIDERNYSPYPQPGSGYVSDFVGVLSDEEEERIEQWLWQVESRSGVEIIVVILDSIKEYPATENQSIETFATALFNTYGIGNMPDNNGVLLLVAKGDRKARIELGKAYGHSRDADAQRIMDEVIIAEFRKGDYVAGITNGTEAIVLEFANLRLGFPWYIVWVIVAAVICLIIGVSLLKSGKKGWGYVFIGLAILLFLLAIYMIVQVARHIASSDSSSWSSGGMGGFGGGSSGGGGATGGW